MLNNCQNFGPVLKIIQTSSESSSPSPSTSSSPSSSQFILRRARFEASDSGDSVVSGKSDADIATDGLTEYNFLWSFEAPNPKSAALIWTHAPKLLKIFIKMFSKRKQSFFQRYTSKTTPTHFSCVCSCVWFKQIRWGSEPNAIEIQIPNLTCQAQNKTSKLLFVFALVGGIGRETCKYSEGYRDFSGPNLEVEWKPSNNTEICLTWVLCAVWCR